jgi:hypothetical protein
MYKVGTPYAKEREAIDCLSQCPKKVPHIPKLKEKEPIKIRSTISKKMYILSLIEFNLKIIYKITIDSNINRSDVKL